MKNKYTCPFCNSEFTWDDEMSESLLKCQSCGKEMTAPSPSFSKGAKVGGYIIERRIGFGGMGEVYAAEQIAMKRKVALKILQDDLVSDRAYLERFFREVRMLAQIEHPNIVRAIEAGVDGKKNFFSMSFVNGSDLKRLIDEGRVFGEEEALVIVHQVAKALKYVWDKHRLLHRDIKPANIMLPSDGEVKLMDLGISKKLSGEDVELTIAGMMVGSPQYISPEQARAEKNIDFRADMYSLGATFFHLITGKTPFPGDSGMAIVAHHLSSPVPDASKLRTDISKRSSALIKKMMAKSKDDRFASWDELIDEINEIITEVKNKKARGKESDERKIISSPSALIGRGKSFIFASPLKTFLFALVSMFILLGAYYTMRKSVAEEKERRAKELFDKASLFYQKNPEPEYFKETIILFGQAQKSGSHYYRQAAKNEIDKIIRRAAEIKHGERARLAQGVLDNLKKKSYEYESKNELDSAISMWKAYRSEGQFAREFEQEISRAVNYLERKKTKEENYE